MNAKHTLYAKIGLVVVLAIVFVGAIANSIMTINRPSPPRRPPASATAMHVEAPLTRAAAVAPAQNAAAPVSPSAAPADTRQRAWPALDLDAIIAYDPFAIAKLAEGPFVSQSKSAATPDSREAIGAAASEAAAATKGSASGRIHAVYQRGGRTTALVGSKSLHVGDNLDGAGRIIEVDHAGVVLEVGK